MKDLIVRTKTNINGEKFDLYDKEFRFRPKQGLFGGYEPPKEERPNTTGTVMGCSY